MEMDGWTDRQTGDGRMDGLLVGWLVGWLVVLGLTAFEKVCQSISGRLPERGRKKREVIDERKKCPNNPTRTYCKHNRPLPYCNPN